MLAKMAVGAGAHPHQDQLDGLSVDAEVKALDNVREHIKNTIAQANLGKELGESSLDQRLAALRAQTGDVTARQQLDQLKAAPAAKAQGRRRRCKNRAWNFPPRGKGSIQQESEPLQPRKATFI